MWVGLTAGYAFETLFWASRAFSSRTYLARISSALSINWSSSTGSTVIVTDLFKAGLVPAFSCVYVLPDKGGLLDDGLSSSSTCYLRVVLPISWFVRSITLLVTAAGSIYMFAIYCFNVATSTYSYRIVVTILVVLVAYGDLSNCSTHLSLLRRFSSLYACFYIVESLSDSVPTKFPFYYDADLRRPEYFLSSSSASESSRWTFSWRSLSRVYLEFNCALNY